MHEPVILNARGHPLRQKALWFIYQAASADGRAYIGVTSRPVHERWQAHLTQAKTAAANGPLHAAIRELGAGAFSVTILAEAISLQDAADKEARYIRERDTIAPAGYNIRRHGLAGARMTNRSIERA